MIVEHSRQTKIENILNALVQEGSFTAAILASKEGLPVALVGQANSVMIAAVAAAMKDLAERAHQGLTEITTRDDHGFRVVSRYFSINEELFLLSVQIPKTRSYRRLTNRAIDQIKKVWLDS